MKGTKKSQIKINQAPKAPTNNSSKQSSNRNPLAAQVQSKPKKVMQGKPLVRPTYTIKDLQEIEFKDQKDGPYSFLFTGLEFIRQGENSTAYAVERFNSKLCKTGLIPSILFCNSAKNEYQGLIGKLYQDYKEQTTSVARKVLIQQFFKNEIVVRKVFQSVLAATDLDSMKFALNQAAADFGVLGLEDDESVDLNAVKDFLTGCGIEESQQLYARIVEHYQDLLPKIEEKYEEVELLENNTQKHNVVEKKDITQYLLTELATLEDSDNATDKITFYQGENATKRLDQKHSDLLQNVLKNLKEVLKNKTIKQDEIKNPGFALKIALFLPEFIVKICNRFIDKLDIKVKAVKSYRAFIRETQEKQITQFSIT